MCKQLILRVLGSFIVTVLINAAISTANDIPHTRDSDDMDDFFQSDEKVPDTDEILESQDDSGKPDYFLNGSISARTGYRFNHAPPLQGATDHRGLFDAKGETGLEFGTRFFESWDFFISGSAFYNLAYELNNQSHYTDKFLDDNEKDLELKKIFIRGSLTKQLDIKIGRQIVVWGKSDNIRVTDILNPLDLKEPGITDIEDLRLPVFMTRLDYYFSNLSLSGFLIHEHRSHKTPVFGSSYFYLPYSLPDDTDPSNRLENTELAISLSGTFPGFDISFYMADIYDDSAFLNAKNQRVHERISMAGLAMNKACGNFLYKAEAALFNGIRLSAFQQGGVLVENLCDYSRLDFLAGIEYSGFKDTNLSLEAADRWLTNFNNDAQKSGGKEHMVQYALRVSRTFLHEVLDLSVLTSLYGKNADDGGFIRAQGIYDFSDAVTFTLGIIFYKSGSNAMLKKIGENDAVFSSITYSF
ncbi:MAG: hypothetical protein KAQ72_01550 [Desulfobacula sp.]|nr:hypothetical protein [Desulfobacula sp.]